MELEEVDPSHWTSEDPGVDVQTAAYVAVSAVESEMLLATTIVGLVSTMSFIMIVFVEVNKAKMSFSYDKLVFLSNDGLLFLEFLSQLQKKNRKHLTCKH